MDCELWEAVLYSPVLAGSVGAIGGWFLNNCTIKNREDKKKNEERYRHANFVLAILANQLNKLKNINNKIQEFKKEKNFPHQSINMLSGKWVIDKKDASFLSEFISIEVVYELMRVTSQYETCFAFLEDYHNYKEKNFDDKILNQNQPDEHMQIHLKQLEKLSEGMFNSVNNTVKEVEDIFTNLRSEFGKSFVNKKLVSINNQNI